MYIIGNAGLDYGHSLLGLLKYIFISIKQQEIIPLIIKYYYLLIMPILLYTIYFIIFYNILLWEKVTLITIMFCLLPSVSADYKLIHFLIPIFLFINDNSKQNSKLYFFNKLNDSQIFIFLFALLLIPKNYRIFTNFVYDGVYIDPLILIFLLIFIISDKSNKRIISNKQ